MFSTARPAIFCLSVIGGLVSLACQAAAEKVPVPPPAAQAESLKLIRSIFKTEYASTDAKTLAKLAGQLYKQAMQSGDDRDAQFTLLREAISVGVKAGDVDAAVSASEAMISSFRVTPAAVRTHTLTKLAETVRTSAARKSYVHAAMQAVNLLVASGDYERAKRLLTTATVVSRKTRDPVLIKQVRQRSKSIAAAQAQDAKMAKFAAILKTSPDDPTANLKMGRYLCLIKGDWKRGLPMLAKSNDDTLKALAQKAIAQPKDSKSQNQLATSFWDWGTMLSGVERDSAHAQARVWYRAAVPGLSGLSKIKAERRLAAAPRKPAGGGKVAAKGPRVINLMPLIDTKKDVVRGEWTHGDKTLTCSSGGLCPRTYIPYQPPEEYDFKIVFSQPKLRNPVFQVLSKGGTSFTWDLGGHGGRCQFAVRGAGRDNPTKFEQRGAFQPNVKYTSVVKVRKEGVQAFINGRLVSQYKTDFSDLEQGGFRGMKDTSVLGVGCDDPCTYYTIEVTEITGKGKITRKPGDKDKAGGPRR